MSVTLHTDVGDIKIELFCEQCPKACENFLALCASDYYNGCLFHRNIKGFIVQTGDPTGTGKGGNSIWGKKFEDEFREELIEYFQNVNVDESTHKVDCSHCNILESLPHDNNHSARGIVSLANNGPNTNGSQFFFTYGEQPHLDLKYTIFGRIIDGFEALDDLEKVAVNPKTFKPLTEVRITSVTIHANPLAG